MVKQRNYLSLLRIPTGLEINFCSNMISSVWIHACWLIVPMLKSEVGFTS